MAVRAIPVQGLDAHPVAHQVQKPFAVADSGFAVSPDRRYILYTQIDERGSDINILER